MRKLIPLFTATVIALSPSVAMANRAAVPFFNPILMLIFLVGAVVVAYLVYVIGRMKKTPAMQLRKRVALAMAGTFAFLWLSFITLNMLARESISQSCVGSLCSVKIETLKPIEATKFE